MDSDGLKIDYFQWEPKSELKDLIEIIGERLHNHAPSDAFVNLMLRKTGHVVKVSCRVASQAGIFLAETASSSPVKAILKVESKIQRQLDHWREHRFSQHELQEEIYGQVV